MCPRLIQESVAESEICLFQFPQSKFNGLSKASQGQNISRKRYMDSKTGNVAFIMKHNPDDITIYYSKIFQ